MVVDFSRGCKLWEQVVIALWKAVKILCSKWPEVWNRVRQFTVADCVIFLEEFGAVGFLVGCFLKEEKLSLWLCSVEIVELWLILSRHQQ